MTSQHYDIVIVGGALVGQALALHLSDLNLSIAIIEPRLFPKEKPDINRDKALAMNASSVTFFQTLGLWESLKPYAQPIKRVHVSEKGAFSQVILNADEIGLDALGQLIPEAALSHVLLSQVESAVTWFRPNKVTQIEKTDSGFKVILEDDTTLTTDLLVGADGAKSKVREALNITATETQTDHLAIVCRIDLEGDPNKPPLSALQTVAHSPCYPLHRHAAL
mgnify:CR=1 FL=1